MTVSLRCAAGLLIALVALPGPVLAEEVMVFAAASLTEALQEIARGYEAASGHKVSFNFGASNDLARQIKAGAPADVFFSADKAQMDGLEAAGLVRGADRIDVLSNQLVVVVAASSASRIDAPGGLLAVGRLALADPDAVPAGVYARAWLESLGLWGKLEERVVPTLNVRAALAAVEAEDADAGIVYPLAPVATSRRAATPDLVRHLVSPAACAVYARHGFVVLAER